MLPDSYPVAFARQTGCEASPICETSPCCRPFYPTLKTIDKGASAIEAYVPLGIRRPAPTAWAIVLFSPPGRAYDNLTAEWQPGTPTEGHLVTQVAVALWKLDRLEGLETYGAIDMVVHEGNLTTRICGSRRAWSAPEINAIAELRRLRQARQSQAEPSAEPSRHPVPRPNS